jgi:hypothetical protein
MTDALSLWLKKVYAAAVGSKSKANLDSNREIFTNVYQNNLWGAASPENESPFYSGPGSSDPQIVDPYVDAVKRFFSSFPAKKKAVDLGCGDFRVGSRIVDAFDSYTACDVVPELVHFNQRYWRHLPVDFLVVDLVQGEIPTGDVLIIRQVLQHLSNDDIAKFTQSIPPGFSYLLLTEHLPSENEFLANRDKVSGTDIRLGSGSGVVLTQPPFNMVFKSETTLISVPQFGGSIVTTLYELWGQRLRGFSDNLPRP